MSVIVPFLVIISYFLIRKVWFENRKIQIQAGIEKISLCTIEPKIILPEIKVDYKYYFEDGVYTGTGYLTLADLLNSAEYYISFSNYGIPIMYLEDRQLVSEEQIETYALSINDRLSIYIDPIEPFNSEIRGLYAETTQVKQN